MYGIFTYIYHKNQPIVGKYTSPMDPQGRKYNYNSPDESMGIIWWCTRIYGYFGLSAPSQWEVANKGWKFEIPEPKVVTCYWEEVFWQLSWLKKRSFLGGQIKPATFYYTRLYFLTEFQKTFVLKLCVQAASRLLMCDNWKNCTV